MATLGSSNLPVDNQKFAANQALKMMNGKVTTEKIYYVDLSNEYGGKSDVFACVMALCPDPMDDEDFYFFFGYYGERWKEEKNVKINVEVWKEKTVHGWLSYKLWKQCIDQLSALTL